MTFQQRLSERILPVTALASSLAFLLTIVLN